MRDLTCPSSLFDPLVREIEGVPDGAKIAMVGGGRCICVGILFTEWFVDLSRIACLCDAAACESISPRARDDKPAKAAVASAVEPTPRKFLLETLCPDLSSPTELPIPNVLPSLIGPDVTALTHS